MQSSQWSLGMWDINSEVGRRLKKLVEESMINYTKDESFTEFCAYGENLGQPAYREETAKFLSTLYDDDVKSSDIVATYGASFGFMLTMTHFFENNDYFFVEDLSFGRMLLSAKNYGLQTVAVECDNEGIDATKLEESFRKYQPLSTHNVSERKPYWAMMYLISICHNPKGFSYSYDRCRKVVELARKYNVLVVTDDVYNLFQYGRKAKRLVAFDRKTDPDYGIGHVVSNGSCSKILFPSLRLGWLECSPWISSQMNCRGDTTGGGGFNAFNQNLCTQILRHPCLKLFLDDMKVLYKHLLDVALKFMSQHCPPEVKFNKPDGSFFLWVELPSHLKSHDLNKRLSKHGVKVQNGSGFSGKSDGGKSYSNCFRLCTSNLQEDELLQQLHILCDEMKKMILESS